MLAAVPARVRLAVPEPPTVTPPTAPLPSVEAMVPALTPSVSVMLSPLESATVTADRSTAVATSSVTVALAGAPVMVGAALAMVNTTSSMTKSIATAEVITIWVIPDKLRFTGVPKLPITVCETAPPTSGVNVQVVV